MTRELPGKFSSEAKMELRCADSPHRQLRAGPTQEDAIVWLTNPGDPM